MPIDPNMYVELLKLELEPNPHASDYVPLFIQINNLVPLDLMDIVLIPAKELYRQFDTFVIKYGIKDYELKRVAYRFGRLGLRSIRTSRHIRHYVVNKNHDLEKTDEQIP